MEFERKILREADTCVELIHNFAQKNDLMRKKEQAVKSELNRRQLVNAPQQGQISKPSNEQKILIGPTFQPREVMKQIVNGYQNTLNLIKVDPFELADMKHSPSTGNSMLASQRVSFNMLSLTSNHQNYSSKPNIKAQLTKRELS